MQGSEREAAIGLLPLWAKGRVIHYLNVGLCTPRVTESTLKLLAQILVQTIGLLGEVGSARAGRIASAAFLTGLASGQENTP